MKRIIAAILLVTASLLLMVGCSFPFYQREAESEDIYLDHIDVTADPSAAYAEKVAVEKSAAVVSIISNSIISTGRGSGSVTQIFSGIIIDAQGYVLTTSNAAFLEVTDGSNTYSNRVSTAYAVLADVYNDSHHYKLTLVDYNTEIGMAVFRFYDRFHHYSNEEKTEVKDGFQVFAEFSTESIATGERCVGIGNSLGNALNAGIVAPDRISGLSLTAMSGIVSSAEADPSVLSPVTLNGNTYSYLLTTVPVNIDMYGGALFDEYGYLIGLLSMKIGYSSADTGESGYFKRVAAVSKTELLTDYIDHVAEAAKMPIPYTVAARPNEEAI